MTRWALGLTTALVLAAPAAAQDTPQDIVKKAVEAHGGLDTLKKFPAYTSDMRGTLNIQGLALRFTGAVAYHAPGKMRQEMTVEAMGNTITAVQIVNGDKVKFLEGGRAISPSDVLKEQSKQTAAVQELSLLYPLLDGDRFTMTAEPDADVNGGKAAVIVVKGKELKETRLYFDRKTGYLVKMKRLGLNPDSREVVEESVFSDFEKVSGVLVPMKQTVDQDGKRLITASFHNYKLLDALDAKLFNTAD